MKFARQQELSTDIWCRTHQRSVEVIHTAEGFSWDPLIFHFEKKASKLYPLRDFLTFYNYPIDTL
ncbi:MAG: hypothetical protein CVV00_01860 [Firmicutes bacterium HGW-Firmicutes-5]|nr:MAG: hypothetical protein CVV00_01860 [Firmicutes bacterium HGW-Firmicutes-5]